MTEVVDDIKSLPEVLSAECGAPLSPSDLEDLAQSEDDIAMITEFEALWKQFLKDNPELMPRGKRDIRIEELHEEVQKLRHDKAAASNELEHQLDFFRTSRQNMEETFAKEKQALEEQHHRLQEEIQTQLDNVAIADHIMSQTLPWEHFLECVDGEVQRDAAERKEPITPVGSGSTIKPSDRARVLMDSTLANEKDMELRAYKVDNALLTCRVKLMQREVETYEKMTQSLEMVGKFLTEHNIWGIFNKTGSVGVSSPRKSPRK